MSALLMSENRAWRLRVVKIHAQKYHENMASAL